MYSKNINYFVSGDGNINSHLTTSSRLSFFFFKGSGTPRDLPFFPTRPSSDLTRQPVSASATPAASPASPPPITITLFKDILFRVAAEARLGDEHHFFCFGKTNENILEKRSEEHTSELQSHLNLVCRLLLEKKK